MRPLPLLALPLLLLAGCSSPPAADDAAEAQADEPFVPLQTGTRFAGSIVEWDGATNGEVCVEVAGGCAGSTSTDARAETPNVAVPTGAISATLDVTWTPMDARYDELRFIARRTGEEPLEVTGMSPLTLDLTAMVGGGAADPITVEAYVAGMMGDLPTKVHDEQFFHAVLTFA